MPPDVAVENHSENETNVNMISILHNILDMVSKSFENNDVDIEHHAILLKLFQSLDILYTNISLTIDQVAEVMLNLLNNNVDIPVSKKCNISRSTLGCKIIVNTTASKSET